MSKGPLVHLEFWDHNQCSGDELKIAKIDLYGILVKEDAKAYYIASWVCDNKLDHNADCYAVVKHKGLKIRRIR